MHAPVKRHVYINAEDLSEANILVTAAIGGGKISAAWLSPMNSSAAAAGNNNNYCERFPVVRTPESALRRLLGALSTRKNPGIVES